MIDDLTCDAIGLLFQRVVNGADEQFWLQGYWCCWGKALGETGASGSFALSGGNIGILLKSHETPAAASPANGRVKSLEGIGACFLLALVGAFVSAFATGGANIAASSSEGRSSEELDPSDCFDQIYAAKGAMEGLAPLPPICRIQPDIRPAVSGLPCNRRSRYRAGMHSKIASRFS